MTYNFRLAARLVRLRALLFAAMILIFAGCDSSQSVGPESSTLTDVGSETDLGVETDPSLETDLGVETESGVETAALSQPSFASVSFAGGIPFGHSPQPLSAFGSLYNGAKLTISPGQLLEYLRAIKARGGKVVLMFAGSDLHYKDRNGFNLAKWKARIDRFRSINFSSYINDGTIIGHYLVDEPQDPNNWYGKTISPATVDEMGRYSKSRWSNMPTIVRVEPRFFNSRHPRYVDAAWAQYITKFGSASDYIRRNVTEAQRVGMALVVGLNISKGGLNRRPMTASQVKSFGSALLGSSYPCAFISWQWDSHLSTTAMKDAMRVLRSKAQSRGARTCRG